MLKRYTRQYVVGKGTSVQLSHQQNYICLKERENKTFPLNPIEVKQRSSDWQEVRDRSVVTGSTLYKVLGFNTLRDQQAHFDKVITGKQEAITDELQALFDY